MHDSTESSMVPKKRVRREKKVSKREEEGTSDHDEEGKEKQVDTEKRKIVGKKPRWWFLSLEDTSRGNKGQAYLAHASKPEHEST